MALPSIVRRIAYIDVIPHLAARTESITEAASYNEVPDDGLSVYLGFEASEIFFRQHGRFPGSLDGDASLRTDYDEMRRIGGEILIGLEGGEVSEELENVLKEM